MNAKEYQYWVNRLAQYDPRDNKYDDRRSVAYREMIRCNVPLKDRVAIHKAAGKLFEERKPRPVDPKAWEQEYECSWVDGAAEPVNPYPDSTEREKPMAKIDWKKPLRGTASGDRYEVLGTATIVGENGHPVMILDDYGRQVGRPRARTTNPQVENVPEEKFFLGLAREPDGTYWLTDDGTVSNMGTMNYWKKHMGDQPHWIVDTRKPAEPPAVNVHDPKDWTVVIGWGNSTTSYGMRTEADARAVAEKHACEGGDVKVVRVRTTPSPADTARYIQLWRMKESHPWRINAHGPAVGGSQEFTWAETQHRGTNSTQCAIKVRD